MTAISSQPLGLGPAVLAGGHVARRWFSAFAGVAGFLSAWALLDVILDKPPSIFVGPWEVARTGRDLMLNGQLPTYTARSLRTVGVAGAVAVVTAVPLGIAIGLSPFLTRSVDQTLRFIRNVSAIAVLPLFVMWFGLGQQSVYALALYTMVVPLIYNSADGVRSVPRKYGMVVKTLGGSWWHEVRHVYLPGALPGILVGLKLAIGYGWRSVVGGELLLRVQGIGGLLAEGRAGNRVDQIMLGMVVVGITFLVIERLVLRNIERLTTEKWSTLL